MDLLLSIMGATMIRIEFATADTIRTVALTMRERDFAELSAVSQADTREELAELLADRYGCRPDVVCGSINGDLVCVGGAIETRPRVVSLLFFATDRFPEIGLQVTRVIRRLFDRFEDVGVHRIEAVTLSGYDSIHRWLHILGLERETNELINYGKNGEKFYQFSRLK